MKFYLSEQILHENPGFKVGAIVIKEIDNSRRVSDLESLLRGMCVLTRNKIMNQPMSKHLKIEKWYQTFGRSGINPEEFPPSISALLQFLQQGEIIPHINTLVDIYHYYSLKYIIPITAKDIDWLCGDLRLGFSEEGDLFRGIGETDMQKTKSGEVVYKDEGGIIQRYWNNREADRTKITDITKNAVLLIEDVNRLPMDEFGEIMKEAQNSIIKYLGGQIEPYILSIENPSINLGVEGRTNLNDSNMANHNGMLPEDMPVRIDGGGAEDLLKKELSGAEAPEATLQKNEEMEDVKINNHFSKYPTEEGEKEDSAMHLEKESSNSEKEKKEGQVLGERQEIKDKKIESIENKSSAFNNDSLPNKSPILEQSILKEEDNDQKEAEGMSALARLNAETKKLFSFKKMDEDDKERNHSTIKEESNKLDSDKKDRNIL